MSQTPQENAREAQEAGWDPLDSTTINVLRHVQDEVTHPHPRAQSACQRTRQVPTRKELFEFRTTAGLCRGATEGLRTVIRAESDESSTESGDEEIREQIHELSIAQKRPNTPLGRVRPRSKTSGTRPMTAPSVLITSDSQDIPDIYNQQVPMAAIEKPVNPHDTVSDWISGNLYSTAAAVRDGRRPRPQSGLPTSPTQLPQFGSIRFEVGQVQNTRNRAQDSRTIMETARSLRQLMLITHFFVCLRENGTRRENQAHNLTIRVAALPPGGARLVCRLKQEIAEDEALIKRQQDLVGRATTLRHELTQLNTPRVQAVLSSLKAHVGPLQFEVDQLRAKKTRYAQEKQKIQIQKFGPNAAQEDRSIEPSGLQVLKKTAHMMREKDTGMQRGRKVSVVTGRKTQQGL